MSDTTVETQTERPIPIPGLNNVGGWFCWRCTDGIGYGEKIVMTSVPDMFGQWQQLAQHEGDCPPSRRCRSCNLIADHASNCPEWADLPAVETS